MGARHWPTAVTDGARRRWQSARTLTELAALTVDWLQGDIVEHAGQGGPPDPETAGITAALVEINQRGLATDHSQPGGAGPNWAQRAHVSGYCQEDIASRIVDVGVASDLVVLATEPELDESLCVPITKVDGAPVTVTGHLSRDDPGMDVSAPMRAELAAAWHVHVLDPVWGREGLLWPTLLDGLRAGPFSERSPRLIGGDLGWD